jgi:hypothetical protein
LESAEDVWGVIGVKPAFKRRPVSNTSLRRRYEAIEELEATRFVANRSQRIVAVAMIAIGIIAGVISLPLIANAYGNTDVAGFVLLAMASGVIGMGVGLQSHPISTAIGIGILCLPLGPLLAFALYWGVLIMAAFFAYAWN